MKSKYEWTLVLLVTFLLVMWADSSRSDVYTDVNLASYHLDNSWNDRWSNPKRPHRDYNQTNFGLGLTWEPVDWIDFRAGFYENSFYKHSNYIGVSTKYQITSENGFSFAPGVFLGGVTGYNETPNETKVPNIEAGFVDGIYPFVLPYVRFGYNRVFANIGIAPQQLFHKDGRLFFSFQLQFKVID